jgi:LPXTG-motif cell wall-anchored protein
LSFTGADTTDLAILGATAVVTGRALYAFGRRRREEEDVVDGADSGPADGD